MAGTGPFLADPYGSGGWGVDGVNDQSTPGVASGTSMQFMLWVFLVGIVVPVFIIGGLQVGGYHFVFKR